MKESPAYDYFCQHGQEWHHKKPHFQWCDQRHTPDQAHPSDIVLWQLPRGLSDTMDCLCLHSRASSCKTDIQVKDSVGAILDDDAIFMERTRTEHYQCESTRPGFNHLSNSMPPHAVAPHSQTVVVTHRSPSATRLKPVSGANEGERAEACSYCISQGSTWFYWSSQMAIYEWRIGRCEAKQSNLRAHKMK